MSEALRDYFRRLDRQLACPRPLRRRLTARSAGRRRTTAGSGPRPARRR